MKAFIIVFIASLLISYLSLSFVEWNMNAGEWVVRNRIICVVAPVGIFALAAMIRVAIEQDQPEEKGTADSRYSKCGETKGQQTSSVN